MSLVGNLEELGLGEILQIVSLSRKTGVLFLSSKGKDGSVFFRHGQVVRATSSTYQQSLGEVLIQRGIVDLPVLRKALSLQQEHGFCERLGVILVRNFGASQEVIEEIVREQIENVVYSLFAWSEGTFKFEVHKTIETVNGTNMDPLQFMLDQGLNPQFLAMEGTRILDEKRHTVDAGFGGDESAGAGADFAFNLVDSFDQHAAPTQLVQQQIVIVDDDGPSLRAIADGLMDKGFVVHAMTRSEETLIKVDTLHRKGERPVVLIDLIMPKMDGSGVLGGVELLELLHNNFKDLQLLVMSDYQHAEAESKIRDFGYSFSIKPRRAEINTPSILSGFLERISQVISNSLPAGSGGERQTRFNLGDELRTEMGVDDDMPQATESLQQSSGLSLLRGMLEELNDPDLQGGVLLLILRFASEFMNRAIIFTINDQLISGFGQFGISGGVINGNERVRAIQFSQEAASMFTEPLRSGQPTTMTPNPTPVDTHVFAQLGDGIPAEIFIGPLISQSRVIGFLYGDNLPERKPIGDIEPLAIFLSQAGVSMEKSLLERKLNEKVMQ